MSWFFTRKRWVNSYKVAYETCMNEDIEGEPAISKSVHFVFYEELKKNLVSELKRLAIYLEEYDESRFNDCIVNSPEFMEGNFHRKHSKQLDPFTETMKEEVRESVRMLNETLKNLPMSYLELE